MRRQNYTSTTPSATVRKTGKFPKQRKMYVGTHNSPYGPYADAGAPETIRGVPRGRSRLRVATGSQQALNEG